MRKSEKDARRREINSQRLLNDVRRGFGTGNNEHLVYVLPRSDFDFQALRSDIYPMHDFNPPPDASHRIVYFKRMSNTPDLPWSEMYRRFAPYQT